VVIRRGYRLLALDIDGTIINSDHQLTRKVRLALHQVARAGVHVVLVSARFPPSVLDFAGQIGLNEPVVTLNGAFVLDSRQQPLYRAVMAPVDVLTILALCRLYNLAANLFVDFEWYVERIDGWIERETAILGFTPKILPALAALADQTEKILIMGDPAQVRELYADLNRQTRHISATFSKPSYCEITASGITKVTGLNQICQALNVPASAVVAIGDNFNDIDMLQFAGLGVAMGNAPTQVQAIADQVIGSNDEDGVADFVLAFDKFQEV
jgi:Cof subfamily protein (haloacid dehalogenase superfamily)